MPIWFYSINDPFSKGLKFFKRTSSVKKTNKNNLYKILTYHLSRLWAACSKITKISSYNNGQRQGLDEELIWLPGAHLAFPRSPWLGNCYYRTHQLPKPTLCSNLMWTWGSVTAILLPWRQGRDLAHSQVSFDFQTGVETRLRQWTWKAEWPNTSWTLLGATQTFEQCCGKESRWINSMETPGYTNEGVAGCPPKFLAASAADWLFLGFGWGCWTESLALVLLSV